MPNDARAPLSLLRLPAPEQISVSDYQIVGIKLLPSAFGTEVSHTATGHGSAETQLIYVPLLPGPNGRRAEAGLR
jgi:hypothetical protein